MQIKSGLDAFYIIRPGNDSDYITLFYSPRSRNPHGAYMKAKLARHEAAN